MVAKGCGIERSFAASTVDEFTELIKTVWAEGKGLSLILAKIEMGTITRPEFASMDHKFNKYTFATYIEGANGVAVDKYGNVYGGEPRPRVLRKYVKVR